MLQVSIRFVNGDAQDWTESDSLYQKLVRLRRDGYDGRQLIQSLFTDDWGPPPVGVSISGTLDDGTNVNEYIPYS